MNLDGSPSTHSEESLMEQTGKMADTIERLEAELAALQVDNARLRDALLAIQTTAVDEKLKWIDRESLILQVCVRARMYERLIHPYIQDTSLPPRLAREWSGREPDADRMQSQPARRFVTLERLRQLERVVAFACVSENGMMLSRMKTAQLLECSLFDLDARLAALLQEENS
jgi:hypothetical protein